MKKSSRKKRSIDVGESHQGKNCLSMFSTEANITEDINRYRLFFKNLKLSTLIWKDFQTANSIKNPENTYY